LGYSAAQKIANDCMFELRIIYVLGMELKREGKLVKLSYEV
jgi:hypothetical protein